MSFPPPKPGVKKPAPKDDDAMPNDADDKMERRKKLAMIVAGGMGTKGPC